MKIDLHMSSIPPMLAFLQDLRLKRASRDQIRDLFNHPDYDFEFRRYEIASKQALIDYFMQLDTIKEADIPVFTPERRTVLKDKHPLWVAAYQDPAQYTARYKKIRSSLTDEALADIHVRVQRGLPAGTDIDTVRVISTMGIGTSFGYVFDGALHFDIMGFEDDSLDGLVTLIAHEVHHLAMWRYVSGFIDELTPAERYILQFTGEGLALKFCNNAKGAISQPVDGNRPINEGLDAFSMGYLNDRFEEAWTVFSDTLAAIRAGEMGEEDVSRQFEAYWWDPYTQAQDRNETPALKQSRIYSFGNDLFGTIYDAFGVEVLFDCVRHPFKAIDHFKHAVGDRAYP